MASTRPLAEGRKAAACPGKDQGADSLDLRAQIVAAEQAQLGLREVALLVHSYRGGLEDEVVVFRGDR